MLFTSSRDDNTVKEIFSEQSCITLPNDAIIIQAEQTLHGPAALVEVESSYLFYIKPFDAEVIRRDVDKDDVFAMARIAEWAVATTKLSKRKQRMRIPTQCVMRAVGSRTDDIDLFLDNEGKAGLSGRLRQMEWYKDAHPEIKTAVLKLFAHLGLFEQQKMESRIEVVNKVVSCFTLLEIHNLFGGLSPGIRLTNILKEQDIAQAISSDVRKRFDPYGQKAIAFFLQNMNRDDFKPIACYALTHYLPEISAYNLQRKTAVAAFESTAARSSEAEISSVAVMLNIKHDEIADLLHRRSQSPVDGNAIARKQNEIEALRISLRELVAKSQENALQSLLKQVDETKRPFSVEFIKHRYYEDVRYPSDVFPEMAVSAKKAGYRSSDGAEIQKLCEIYHAAENQPEKFFDLSIADTANDVYRYVWLKPDDPDLYTLSMLCGGTCMRPSYAGEAALWEAVLSRDVAICSILDYSNEIVAYFRVNYDQENGGIYIDTVESRFSYVLNNEDVWRAVRRAVIDMALAMNSRGTPMQIINFREERGNRLKVQWERLPVASIILRGKAYRHPNAPWPYGDDKPRLQKEVWRTTGVGASLESDYRKISIDRKAVLSKGANGMVYVLDELRVIKVFPSYYPMERVRDEYEKACLFHSRNLPSPHCYEIVWANDCPGIIFERIHGISLTKAVQQHPEKLNYYIGKMIDLLRKIHSIDATGLGLDSVKHQYLEYLFECRGYYSIDDYRSLRKLIMAIPDRCTLLHGDFHSENLMAKSNDELVMIDFAGVGYGHPIFDLMAEGAVMPVTLENNSQIVERYLDMEAEQIQAFWVCFIRSYFGKRNNAVLGRDTVLMSRLRNAVTAAITSTIPEEYLRLCAQNTHHLLIPEVDRLTKSDWNIWG